MKDNKVCKFYREINCEARCVCNNEIDYEGDCVYTNGIISGEPICKFYQPKAYTVLITQTLCGTTDIVANSIEEALEIAQMRYVENGEELPDMDDVNALNLQVVL